MRNRQERQSDGAVGGRPHSRRQHLRAPPPRAVSGSTLVFSNEPPTLLIENAGTSGARTIWLQLEVGTDANFQQLVYQADQIALGGNGRTAYRLPSPLGAGYTYYLADPRSRRRQHRPLLRRLELQRRAAGRDRRAGCDAPSGKITTNKPEFKVTNGAISGTSGVVYRFEVSQVG